ncbi:MAG: bifunctional helix-turn-helix transcriptional regulator/GNAT family N-acetyltransferase [Pseudomonadota bacterium]|uniref:bifunctional helix-turn-helix transcriptional regulator/GNAT family N-acetyltransferase n=1 Tax=Sphingomonas sp. ERG5 TaxID=1381597 RepID=UPI00054BA7FD|nr:bifunctional helix-turn-helix transcriptional regulator/GNAT family N-acetyltransferase [Sphingomonas sp. ERG5]
MDVVSERPLLFLGSRLKRLAEQMQNDVTLFSQRAGIAILPGQYPLLVTLGDHGPQTVGELARAMRMSQPAITQNLRKLVTTGYIEISHDDADKRTRTVSLTPAGEAALALSERMVWPSVKAAVSEVIDGLSGSLLDQLSTIEKRLSDQPLNSRAAAIAAPKLVVARDTDVPAIVALMNAAYRGTDADAGWNTEAGYIDGTRTSEPFLRQEISEKPHATLLLWRHDADDRLKGCVWLEPLGDNRWYLGSLTVDPLAQNGGSGRRLLAAAEHWVRERQGTEVRMSVVNVRDGLLAWYARRGYALTGETAPFPYGDDRFGIPRRDDLHFVILNKRFA